MEANAEVTRFRDKAARAAGTSPRTMQNIVAIGKWAPDLLPALDERHKAGKKIGITAAAGEARQRRWAAIVESVRFPERYASGELAQVLRADERACRVCGQPFWAWREDARYCSAAHRQKAYRQRRAGP